MNGNSSKQVLLSVLGIAILVVAVVGVSFAFFSYTKTGNTNNTIRTGQIYTYLTEGDNIQLTNALPLMSNINQAGMKATTQNDIGALEFSVTGMNQSETDINYAVYLSKGLEMTYDESSEVRPRLADSDMRLIMKPSDVTGNVVSNSNIDNGLNEPQLISTLKQANGTTTGSMDTGDILIAHGTFAADTAGSNAQVVHGYLINLYVDPMVKISDTDTEVNGQPTRYCAHHTVGAPQNTTAGTRDANGNLTGANYGCELYRPNGTGAVTHVPTGKTVVANVTDEDTQVAGTYLTAFSDAYYSIKIRVVANTATSGSPAAPVTNYDYNPANTTGR